MIAISKSTKGEINKFNFKEWRDADVMYYGKYEPWVERSFVFKAEDNGEIAGDIYGKFAGGVLFIDDLIVAKDKRGLGIGKMLMQKAEEFGLSLKAHRVYLLTGKTWNSPRGFYESLGYKKTGDLADHYKHADFVIYEKPLQ